MSRLWIPALVVVAAAAACSAAPPPKPLPGGLPPEYEAPRAFSSGPDPNALESWGKKPLVSGPQPPAPTGTNPTTPAPGPPAPRSP
ncbi:MAG: hypothetical protein ABJE95_14005 [Byssovorax sp.]